MTKEEVKALVRVTVVEAVTVVSKRREENRTEVNWVNVMADDSVTIVNVVLVRVSTTVVERSTVTVVRTKVAVVVVREVSV